MATKEYSCVKRTKRSFENSLAALSRERPLNKITVKMLCEHAQLSRNAFYFHYKDINDLITDVEDGIVNEALSNFDTFREIGFPKNVRATIVALIELIDSRREVCRMLFDSSDTFTAKMSKAFCDFNYQYFEEYHGKGKINRTSYDFFYMFISSGFYGLLKYWLDNPEKMSKNELIGLTYVLIKRLLVVGDPDIEFTPKNR
ncbi:MAG: TetR family transcriptional regulator C-terminal domain-containing protein [Clostridia bacterium]|nr:TetR family transcriptional regulator C-terminal domain-containing protein [Clostridia bacterium]